MRKNAIKIIVFFVIFFIVGLVTYQALNYFFIPGKMAVYNTEEPAADSVSGVAARVSPSVVGITNLSREGDLFSQRDVEKTGSGVILDNEGYIVTNNHVVQDAERLVVTLADGNEEDAEVVGTDARTDLALIKIKVDRHVTPAKLGDSDQLVVGEQVVAIGNPLGLRFARSVTAGVVSGINRLLTTEEGFVFRLIQTDAAINPGNSGGALVNLQGEVIGINTVKIAVQGFEGMGFSIPSNQVKTVVEEIRKNGRVLRPLMGIRILGEITQDQAKYFQLPILHGVAIEPLAGGPAAKAGLRKYDIITRIDNDDIQSGSELQEKIFAKKIGQTVTVRIMRLPENQKGKNEVKEFKIKLTK